VREDTMRESTIHGAALLRFYQQEVLPNLFRRLDRAFPELRLAPVETGWVGTIESCSAGFGGPSPLRIVCHTSWGFLTPAGEMISWASYVRGRDSLAPEDILPAFRQLAEAAGVDDGLLHRQFTDAELNEARRELRHVELLEAFVAYCRDALRRQNETRPRTNLPWLSGADAELLDALPLGLYTSPAKVRRHLQNLGFSEEEIAASKVTRDSRLAGRWIIPWRDRWGQIRTIAADAPGRTAEDTAPRICLNKIDFEEPFGLDAALRDSAGGREHLILVDDLWNVLHFRALGMAGVASLGNARRALSMRQWELLADCGIRDVTLALADDEAGRDRTLSAIHRAQRATRAPQVFALPVGVLGPSKTPALFSQLQGLNAFGQVLHERRHGYHYVAEAMVRKHKPELHWTDAGLVAAIRDAVEFDALVYCPDRAWHLERFFWPTILMATGAKWDIVRTLLKRRPSLSTWSYAWPIDDYRELVRQLEQRLHCGGFTDFRALIRAAAESYRCRDQRPELPENEPATVPLFATTPPEEPDEIEDDAEAIADELTEKNDSVALAGDEDGAATQEETALVLNIESAPPDDSSSWPPDDVPLPAGDVHRLAYQIWESKGRPHGADRQCWLQAEKILRCVRVTSQTVDPGVTTKARPAA